MKYFLIAGEASGDLHASNLMKGLKKIDAKADFSFIGGDLMAEVSGREPFRHFSEMNIMGFVKVILHIHRLRDLLRSTRVAIAEYEPDTVILVDFAGFNLRIARFASSKGLNVFYYIPPKVWAWRKSRIKLLRRYVTRLFVIFPFEVDFYKEQGIEVEYFGNPLVDVIEEFRNSTNNKEEISMLSDPGCKIVALLAGSRKQEIELLLPEMVKAARNFPDYRFIVAGAPSVEPSLYNRWLKGTGINIVHDLTYPLLEAACAAIVTSGTATLETALLGTPQVVVYRIGRLTYAVGRVFVKFRFFSLVNLIFGDELVKELLQVDLEKRINSELVLLLENEEHRKRIISGYAMIRKSIGEAGVSERIANRIIELQG